MTKQNKQLVLIAVLALTLYYVWPADKTKQKKNAASQPEITPVTLTASEPPPIKSLQTIKPLQTVESPGTGIPAPKQIPAIADQRKRWTIDEILEHNPFRNSVSIPQLQQHDRSGVQAIYYSSSPNANPVASAVVGGVVIPKGTTLTGDRNVVEIHAGHSRDRR